MADVIFVKDKEDVIKFGTLKAGDIFCRNYVDGIYLKMPNCVSINSGRYVNCINLANGCTATIVEGETVKLYKGQVKLDKSKFVDTL